MSKPMPENVSTDEWMDMASSPMYKIGIKPVVFIGQFILYIVQRE